MKYISVVLTLVFVTYGQLIIKYGINRIGPHPTSGVLEIANYFVRALTNIWILSGLFAAFIASLAWMAALSKFELSSVYPILSLNFVLVPLLSVYIFGESINAFKVVGILMIVLGVFVFSRGVYS